MGFSVFQKGTTASVEAILADPVARQVLHTLHTEHLFLTLGQIRHYLRVLAPAGASERPLHRDDVLPVFDRLVDAGYLGVESALLPPVTISHKGVFGKSFAAPAPEDLTEFADLARSRVPPLNLHSSRRLYHSMAPLAAVLRSCGHLVRDWSDSENLARQLGSSPREFEWVFAEHKEVERYIGHSPYDIARTLLTAQYNLNEVRFKEQYRAEITSGARMFVAHKPPTPAFLDGMFIGPGSESTGLYFLRPFLPHELRKHLDNYSAQAFDIAMGRDLLTRCVWM